jgi:hypothetical protein
MVICAANKYSAGGSPFAKAFNDHQTAFFAAVAFVQQRHWFLFSMASLPKLFLQCCQFAALSGAD